MATMQKKCSPAARGQTPTLLSPKHTRTHARARMCAQGLPTLCRMEQGSASSTSKPPFPPLPPPLFRLPILAASSSAWRRIMASASSSACARRRGSAPHNFPVPATWHGTCKCAHTRTHTHARKLARTHTHTRAHTCTHAHTHTHTHGHTHTYFHMSMPDTFTHLCPHDPGPPTSSAPGCVRCPPSSCRATPAARCASLPGLRPSRHPCPFCLHRPGPSCVPNKKWELRWARGASGAAIRIVALRSIGPDLPARPTTFRTHRHTHREIRSGALHCLSRAPNAPTRAVGNMGEAGFNSCICYARDTALHCWQGRVQASVQATHATQYSKEAQALDPPAL